MNNLDDIIIKALATKKSKEFLLAHPAYPLNFWQRWRQRYFLHKYKQGWPIAYLAGHKEFCNLDFLVNKHTLIPRPETELLVEEAVEEIKKKTSQNIQLIDIGTGTGCVPISVARMSFPRKRESFGATDPRLRGDDSNHLFSIFASDISGRALRVAKKNARQHQVNIKFVQGSLLQPLLKKSLWPANANLIITANLPYLTQEQFLSESSIQKEPRRALIADQKNGLSLYAKLLQQIKNLKQSTVILLEIDPQQSTNMAELVQSTLSEAEWEIKKDLAGRDRLVIIKIN